MPVSLKNTNYGESHAARRHASHTEAPKPAKAHGIAPVASPAPKIPTATPVMPRPIAEAAKDPKNKEVEVLGVPVKSSDYEYDDSEETDDTDAFDVTKPKKKKKK